ncbi:uncharacterized protein LOC108051190 [Drosophila rhopaloa]|uniref:Uncharacterized protein LOC108051190 n=1 Tax=Drosophila rhopaloa TaxID=1041015 RepID=A0A6P4FHE6_DRORH|nr:uncharacterized protein LOC108051190 [Drosophila rhopaloa]
MSSLEGVSLPTELPPCAAGFTWVILMNTCLPNLARTRTKCAHGYYMHPKFGKCMRRRYDKKQQNGVIKDWIDSKPKTTTTKRPRPATATPYEGAYYAYNAGFGRGKKRKR